MPMRIIAADCTYCAGCEEDCPSDAISPGEDTFVVDQAKCTECEGEHESPLCVDKCPIDGCIERVDQAA